MIHQKGLGHKSAWIFESLQCLGDSSWICWEHINFFRQQTDIEQIHDVLQEGYFSFEFDFYSQTFNILGNFVGLGLQVVP